MGLKTTTPLVVISALGRGKKETKLHWQDPRHLRNIGVKEGHFLGTAYICASEDSIHQVISQTYNCPISS